MSDDIRPAPTLTDLLQLRPSETDNFTSPQDYRFHTLQKANRELQAALKLS